MQGILYSNYKLLEDYINVLEKENLTNSYCPYYENIVQHKETLLEIYNNYKFSYKQMAAIIKQFEEHKSSIKRLVILQKKKKKEMIKNSSAKVKNGK